MDHSLASTVGLDDQEPDDQAAEDDEFRVRDAGGGNLDMPNRLARAGSTRFSTDGQHHDEGRAKEAAHDGAQAADDHHEQQLEGDVHREGGRLPGAQVHKGPQRAGHADDEGADGKRG